MTTPETTTTQAPAAIGQVVWFYPGKFLGNMNQLDKDQPMLARVCFVNPDNTVNLFVVDHIGVTHAPREVPIYKDGDKKNRDVEYVQLQPTPKKVEKKDEAKPAPSPMFGPAPPAPAQLSGNEPVRHPEPVA